MQPIQQSLTRITPSVIHVAIYTRVSTLHQVGGRFDSCESQAAICRDYIKKHAHEGWVEYACHTDAAYSGGTMNRPGLQALMRQIEAGAGDEVIVLIMQARTTDAELRDSMCRDYACAHVDLPGWTRTLEEWEARQSGLLPLS